MEEHPRETSVATASTATIYQPLDSREIRLLQIKPSADFEADIHCSMQTVSLDDDAMYVAMSYEWGSPCLDENAVRVFVDTVEVDATINLRLALQHLRRPLEDNRMIWIDAICINQADMRERGHQVGFMRDIYQKAAKVIAWLGAAKGGETDGVALIANFYDIWFSSNDLRNKTDKEIHETIDKREEEFLSLTLCDPAYSSLWRGWVQIVDSSYWKRLWILQEVLVNPNVEAHRGSTSVPLIVLNVISSTVYTHIRRIVRTTLTDNALDLIGHTFDGAKALQSVTTILRGRFPKSLFKLLISTPESLCTDPRDRIYALLGIAALPKRASFPINYEASLFQIYLDTARYLVEVCGDLRFLCYCRKKSNTEPRLPSWVPDWNQYIASFVDGGKFPEDQDQDQNEVCSSSDYAMISPDAHRLKITAEVLGELDRFLVGNGSKSRREVAQHLSSCLRFARIAFQEPEEDEGKALDSILFTVYTTMILSTHKFFTKSQDQLGVRAFLYSLLSGDEQSQPGDALRFELLRLAFGAESSLCSITLADGKQKTLGACPSNAKSGDLIVIVQSCCSPLILRPKGDCWELISDIFVYGCMDRDATGKFPLSEFTLL